MLAWLEEERFQTQETAIIWGQLLGKFKLKKKKK